MNLPTDDDGIEGVMFDHHRATIFSEHFARDRAWVAELLGRHLSGMVRATYWNTLVANRTNWVRNTKGLTKAILVPRTFRG